VSSAGAMRACLSRMCVPPLTDLHPLEPKSCRSCSELSSLDCRRAAMRLPASISAKAIKSRPNSSEGPRACSVASDVYRWRRAVATDIFFRKKGRPALFKAQVAVSVNRITGAINGTSSYMQLPRTFSTHTYVFFTNKLWALHHLAKVSLFSRYIQHVFTVERC
jgi:hypothetical protein